LEPNLAAIEGGETMRDVRNAHALLAALRSDLIDPTIAVHHGRVVKRTGDDKDSGARPG
jgi:hypothetical protein